MQLINVFLCTHRSSFFKKIRPLLFLYLFSTTSYLSAQTYLIDAVDGTTVTTCGGYFLDSGGHENNYSDSESYAVTFCSDSGNQMGLAFSFFDVEYDASCSFDYLEIYDGTSTGDPLLGKYCIGNVPGLVTATSTCLHVVWSSDGGAALAGWEAEIVCHNGPKATPCTNEYSVCGVDFNYTEVVDGAGVLTVSNMPSAYNSVDFKKEPRSPKEQLIWRCHDSAGQPCNAGAFTFGLVNGIYNYSIQVQDPDYSHQNMICWNAQQMSFGCPDVNVDRVTITPCYQSGGQSKATVEAEISWFGTSDDSIAVTLGGTTRYIRTGLSDFVLGQHRPYYTPTSKTAIATQDIISPQVISFEVDADGSAMSIEAEFANTASVTHTENFTVPTSCEPDFCVGGDLGGIVFIDYNNDGIKNLGENKGAAGVDITVYAPNGNTYGPVTTDQYGLWDLTVPIGDFPVRVEFANIPNLYHGGYSTFNGTDGMTSVQFIAAPECEIDLGVNIPDEFCEDQPLIITSCYVNGDPLLTGTAENAPAIVGFPYSSSGDPAPKTFEINAGEVGSTWGQQYSRSTATLFSATTLRRHAGMGPGGYDAIYYTDLSTITSPGTPQWFNLSTYGINVGTIPSNATRGLPANITTNNTDAAIYADIGGQGIGGIGLSIKEDTLWVVNVADGTLNALNLTTFNTTGNAADITAAGTFAIPSMGCERGEQKSWACRYYQGAVYVGSVCTANDCGRRSDLKAAIHVFNPSNTTFQQVMEFPLSYPKGPGQLNINDAELGVISGWFPWIDFAPGAAVYPQPIFKDLDFDIDGSMTIGFGDRYGLQWGYENNDLDGNCCATITASGDILRAYKSNNTYILENNAYIPGFTGAGVNNFQGPGLGEFYNDDIVWNNLIYHAESSLGGLAIRPGSGEVVMAAMDPITDPQTVTQEYFSGGIRRFDNTTGEVITGYQVYVSSDSGNDGSFGKAAGIGDICFACGLPTYMEIGNRVWIDTDGDGVQDADETGIQGVNVSLYEISGVTATLVAQTTTDVVGGFFFSETGETYDTLKNSTVYRLVFGEGGQYSTVDGDFDLAGTDYFLTNPNNGEGTHADLNDHDAFLETNAGFSFIDYPVIDFTTGDEGYVNHSFDMGIRLAPVCILTITEDTVNPCDDNGSGGNASDDTFDVTVNATATDGGGSNQFNVTDGISTWGPFTYGTSGTVTGLPADGSTITLTFSDNDDATCSRTTMVSQNSCSNGVLCPPMMCLPISVSKNDD